MYDTEKPCKLGEYFEKLPKTEVSRRGVLKSAAFLGGSALLMNQIESAFKLLNVANAATIPAGDYPLAKAGSVIYSCCLQCHTACPIKVKILNGVAVKIDGNPFSENLIPNINYKTNLSKAAKIDAGLCPKGQAGIQSLYDPYRVVKVLKRKGPRGSNKWEIVSFDKAINEIVNGGQLFQGIGERLERGRRRQDESC